MDAMLNYYDGNTGGVYYEEYSEVMRHMSYVWNHLSINDRKRYTNADNGAYFCVVDTDTMITIWDVADLIGDELLDCDRLGFDISPSGERW